MTGRFSILALSAALAVAPVVAHAEIVSLRVASARAFPEENGGARLAIALTPASAEKLGAFTSSRVGMTIEVRVSGKAVASPVIREPVLGGSLEISQVGTIEETTALAQALSDGKAALSVRDKD